MRPQKAPPLHSISLLILNSGNVNYNHDVHNQLLPTTEKQNGSGLAVICSQESAQSQAELSSHTHIDNRAFMVKTKLTEGFSYLALDVFHTGEALTASTVNHQTHQYRQANKGGVFTEIELTENSTGKKQAIKFVSLHLDANSPHKKYSQFLHLMENALSPDQTVVNYDDILANINLITAGDFNIRIEGRVKLKNDAKEAGKDCLLESDDESSALYNTLGVTPKLRQLISLCGAGELVQLKNDQHRTYEKQGFSKKQRHNDIGDPVKDEGVTERATSNPCATVHLNQQVIHTTYTEVSDHHLPTTINGSIHFLSEEEKFNRYKQHIRDYMLMKMKNTLGLPQNSITQLQEQVATLENNSEGKDKITFLYNVILRTNMLLAKALHFDTLAIEKGSTRSEEDIQQQCLTPRDELKTLASDILQKLNTHFPDIQATATAINQTLNEFTSSNKQALKHKDIYQSFKGLRGVLNYFINILTRFGQTITFHKPRTRKLIDQLQETTSKLTESPS